MIRIKAGEAIEKYGIEQLKGVKAALLDTCITEESGELYEGYFIVFGEIDAPLDDGEALRVKDYISDESFFAFHWEFIILDDAFLVEGGWHE